MNTILELLKDGFRILRNERSEAVQSHGIPTHLIKRAYELLKSDRREEILSKIEKIVKFYDRDYRVFYITGVESPTKEALAVLVLVALLAKGRLVRYYLAPSFDTHDRGDCSILGIDAAKGLSIVKVRQFIREHVGRDRTIVIGGHSMDSLREALEDNLFEYLQPQAIEIESPEDRKTQIPKV